MSWLTVCNLNDIVPNTGICALVDNEQVAIFRVTQKNTDTLYAISNYDPFSKANVLSRGIVGCKDNIVTVASPIYKQLFALETGKCLDDESVKLKAWKVQLNNNSVEIEHSQIQAA
jgi:nitrite reductase (NADH) small subunit